MTKAFSQWCRPNPYFLLMLVEPPNCMRLSLRKVAHNCSRPVLRGRKYGKLPAFTWFSLKENHTSLLLTDHSNFENALDATSWFPFKRPAARWDVFCRPGGSHASSS